MAQTVTSAVKAHRDSLQLLVKGKHLMKYSEPSQLLSVCLQPGALWTSRPQVVSTCPCPVYRGWVTSMGPQDSEYRGWVTALPQSLPAGLAGGCSQPACFVCLLPEGLE